MTDRSEAAPSIDAEITSGVGWRFALGFAGAMVLASAVALIALNSAGSAARAVPTASPAIVVVDDARGLLGGWTDAGVHGAKLVYVTRDLGYALPDNVFQHSAVRPVPLLDLQQVFRDGTARPNVVWVATHAGIVRSVTYVLTPQDLAEKVALGRQNGWPGIAADGRSISAADEEGFVRVVGAELPSGALESAVLNIDASYFVNGTPEELAAQLADSVDSYGLVTLNRSQDATDVPDAARVKLDRMAALLRERGAK